MQVTTHALIQEDRHILHDGNLLDSPARAHPLWTVSLTLLRHAQETTHLTTQPLSAKEMPAPPEVAITPHLVVAFLVISASLDVDLLHTGFTKSALKGTPPTDRLAQHSRHIRHVQMVLCKTKLYATGTLIHALRNGVSIMLMREQISVTCMYKPAIRALRTMT